MFAWLTDVFASTGFVPGEAWALQKDRHWRQWKIAFATWWVVRVVRAPQARMAAFLARHSAVGRWARRVWIVAGLGAFGYAGPTLVGGWCPWPMPGVNG